MLPFFALIWPQVQRSRRGIAGVAALLVLSAIVHGWWLVVPASGRGFGLLDVLAMLGLLGIAAAFALRAPLVADDAGMRCAPMPEKLLAPRAT